jgi:hypothetical protein
MNIVSLESGRTTWLFPVEEILPLGGSDGPKLIAAISSKYKFAHPPANPTREDVDKNGLKFAGGQMVHKGNISNIAEFVVFNDGIVSVSNSTENAEAFLQDIYAFLVSEFAFREITSDVKKVHLSTVVVDFDTSLNNFVQGRSTEIDLIGKHLNAIDNTDFPVEVTRIDFVLNKDPEFRPPNLPRLTIEKRAHTQFSQHRYFSAAPIHTAKHLEILERIERGLRKGKS